MTNNGKQNKFEKQNMREVSLVGGMNGSWCGESSLYIGVAIIFALIR